jgi:thiol-disulfide isomerase/thioredoxin
MQKYLLLISYILMLAACNTEQTPKMGVWRAELALEKAVLPFNFTLVDSQNVLIHNAEERLEMTYFIKKDSIHIKSPIFDSEIIAKLTENGTQMQGFWHNYSRKDKNVIPFSAKFGVTYRFEGESETEKNAPNYAGKWKVDFGIDTDEPYAAIGEFQQKGNIVTGTFLTETGDYRFLQGIAQKNLLQLSCFDGSHAFYFSAKPNQGNLAEGVFYSGIHYAEKWRASLDKEGNFQLPKADTLTYLKHGYGDFTFSFPNLEKKMVSLQDEKYKNKVVIVQLMGSWCPNCMDETAYLTEIYEKYNSKGLEIISLAYEKSNDFDKAAEAVKRIQSHFQAKYDFLIAGTSNKQEAANTLPMLNKIVAYPTAIFVDKKGKVRKIHTGFSGPGTGQHYKDFVQETAVLLEKMLAE